MQNAEPPVNLWKNAMFNYISFYQIDRHLQKSCLLFKRLQISPP